MPASSQSRAMENPKNIGITSDSEQIDQNRQREAIEKLAYALWEKRGCPAGTAEADWLEAEQKLSERSATAAAKG
jgi:hypothetical protein